MKFLHTSDWHLGRALYGRKRYEEFELFLNWLLETIEKQKIDALLVAGDIFDTSTPSNRAQQLYYRFLINVAKSHCQHVVVIAGNHDSPSFLGAPKELLNALNVYVVSEMTESPEDEVIELKNSHNETEAIICAVPYLRDKDLRTVTAGESIEDKMTKLIDGLKQHYNSVCEVAEQKQNALMKREQTAYVPIVGMGHLFTSGGKTLDGDGVRDLYVGTLAHIGKDDFPSSIDYLALGHLHIAQKVGSEEHIRYCGSPIPMGFGEASQDKKVVLIEFNERVNERVDVNESDEFNQQTQHSPTQHSPNQKSIVEELLIPCFQVLSRITGTVDEIVDEVNILKIDAPKCWLEIEYTGKDVVNNLSEIINELIENTEIEVRRIKNKRVIDKVLSSSDFGETLDDLNENEVFERCLETFEVSEQDKPELIHTYREIIQSINENDTQAE
ncbi:MAG: exonuclease SbcCD subunit D C-terminal domain-containing protein [Gammaproteobacteria bacterium]|nr:exonuclease SbcCD subunit D C-terminal domain-containing protein [Gammaproteobacteria bacterium]